MIRGNAAAWQDALAGPGDVRRRPAPGTWSALEYGCHVRDVLRRYDERLRLMLAEDDPLYPNWDQDATAVADRYSAKIPPWWLLNWPKPPRSSRSGSRT